MKRFHLYIAFLIMTCAAFAQLKEAKKRFNQADYQKAYSLYKEASLEHIEDDDPILYVQCNLMMGECKVRMGEPESAGQLAANITQYIEQYFPKNGNMKGQTHTLQGKAYLSLGRNDLALEHLKKAENLLGDTTSMATAECFSQLGLVYWNNKNLDLSQQYLEQALAIRKNLLDATAIEIGDSFNNLGLIYQEENPLQALIYFNRAKNIYEENYGLNHPKTALVANNLAFANAHQGSFEEAFQLLDQVRAIYDELYPGEHPTKAFALSSIGRVHAMQKNWEQALNHERQALKMYIRLFGVKHPEVANTYYLMAEAYQNKEEYELAVEHFQKAIYANLLDQSYESVYELPEIRDYFNADILLSSLQGKAIALEEWHYNKTLNTKDLTGAVATYEKCDELISVIRQLRQNESDKIRLGQTAKEVYESGIRISLTLSEQTFRRKHYREKAFQFCERSKSAVLLEAITETKAKEFAGIPSHLIETEDSLKAEIAFFERQLASQEDQEKYKNLLFKYQAAYHDFIDELEQDYPEYYDLKYSQQIVSADEVSGTLDKETAMLSYFLGENNIYVFLIDKRNIKAYTLDRQPDFLKMATSFRNAIRYQLNKSIIDSGKALFEQLFPIDPTDYRSLVILPDGVLGTLPFEAFIVEDRESRDIRDQAFLIRSTPIAYDYSATLFVERHRQTSHEREENILLCAPISFNNEGVELSALPDSEKEIDEIRYFFMANGGAAKKIGKEANESLIKSEEIRNYKYLHFATHGIVNESKPELSRIFLSPTAQEDGSLYAGEIYNLDINADLVTLSACETGLGKIAKGEGIVGLSRALQYAGAKNLIVSLWQVADASTAKLMIKFYDKKLHGSYTDYHGPLREAKLHLLSSDEYHEPYYWAPFILVGY